MATHSSDDRPDRVADDNARQLSDGQAIGHSAFCCLGFHSMCDGHTTNPPSCPCPETQKNKHLDIDHHRESTFRGGALYSLSLGVAIVSMLIGLIGGLAFRYPPLGIAGAAGLGAAWALREFTTTP